MTEGTPDYLARLCWNTDQWHHPTGEASKLETGSYAAEAGFGHEEWLFNEDWIIDGYKYGYLQPVRKTARAMPGTVVDILCYSIGPQSERLYVARIPQCEILTEEQARFARDTYDANGWLGQMRLDIAAVGGDVEMLHDIEPEELVNVRFRLEEAELFLPALEVPQPERAYLDSLRRYQLFEAPSNFSIQPETGRATGSDVLRRAEGIQRSGNPAHVADPAEARLQNALFKVLKGRYTESDVKMERFRTDVSFKGKTGRVLIEVKVRTGAYEAIRSALGQILDYSYRSRVRGEPVEALYVISPAPLSPSSEGFLRYVNEGRGLQIRYVQFTEDAGSVDI